MLRKLFSTCISEHSEHGKLFYIADPSKLRAEGKTVAFKKIQASSLVHRVPEVFDRLQYYRLGKTPGMAIYILTGCLCSFKL